MILKSSMLLSICPIQSSVQGSISYASIAIACFQHITNIEIKKGLFHRFISGNQETMKYKSSFMIQATLSLDDKVRDFSEGLATIWKVHGFREGSTRLAVTFCYQFIEALEAPIDRTIFERHSAYVRTALVAYCATFHSLSDLPKKEYPKGIIIDSVDTYSKEIGMISIVILALKPKN